MSWFSKKTKKEIEHVAKITERPKNEDSYFINKDLFMFGETISFPFKTVIVFRDNDLLIHKDDDDNIVFYAKLDSFNSITKTGYFDENNEEM